MLYFAPLQRPGSPPEILVMLLFISDQNHILRQSGTGGM